VVTAAVAASLPSLRAHLARPAERVAPGLPLFRPLVLTSFAMTAVTMAGGFLVIPNISAYVQTNLGLPRSQLQWVYGIGGLVSFATLRLVGRLVDRFGSFRVGTVASVVLAVVFDLMFVHVPRGVPVMTLAISLFFAFSSRNVSYNTLATRVPEPTERARFMSFQSAVQHLASALGASVSAQVLFVQPDGSLGNVPMLGWMAIALTLLLPVFLFFALSSRNVSYNTLATKVPEPAERARFMSFQSAVQHLASALGASVSAQVLFVQPDGSLGNVPMLGRMAIALTLLLPVLLFRVERGVRQRVPPPQALSGPLPGGMATAPKKV